MGRLTPFMMRPFSPLGRWSFGRKRNRRPSDLHRESIILKKSDAMFGRGAECAL